MGNSIDRRKFLGGCSGGRRGLHRRTETRARRAGKQAPSEKLNLAAIGIGGMGSSNINQCRSENFVALCDVDDGYAGKVFNQFPSAKKYKDFRVMLDKEDKNIDGVVVATPDHTHAVVAMACIQRGKHIYLQKPLAHSIYEVRKVTEAAREAKVQTQMGNQGHSSDEIRLLYEWIADGAIGPVHEVYAWSDPTGGRRPVVGFSRSWPGRKTHRGCPRRSTGTCGWVRHSTGPITRSIIPCLGGGSGISGRAPWATWAAISWTRHSGCSIWASRLASRPRPRTISRRWLRRPIRGPRSFGTSSRPGATCLP